MQKLWPLPRTEQLTISLCLISVLLVQLQSSSSSPYIQSYYYRTNIVYRTTYVLDDNRNLLDVSSNIDEFYESLDGEFIGEGLACSDQFVYLTSDGEQVDQYGRVYRFQTAGPVDQTPTVVLVAYQYFISSLSLTPSQTEIVSALQPYGYHYTMGVIHLANNTLFPFCTDDDQPDPTGPVVTNSKSIVFSQYGSEYLCYLNQTVSNINKCGLCDKQAYMPRKVLAASVKGGSSTVYSSVAQLSLYGTYYTVSASLPLPYEVNNSSGWDGLIAIPGSAC